MGLIEMAMDMDVNNVIQKLHYPCCRYDISERPSNDCLAEPDNKDKTIFKEIKHMWSANSGR